MDPFCAPPQNRFLSGIGKEIQDSENCSEKKNYTLYVTGIPPDMGDSGLKNIFSRCGKVLVSSVLHPKKLGYPKAGFIEYGSMVEMLAALERYTEFQLGRYTLRATIAKKKERPARPLTINIKDEEMEALVEESIRQNSVRADRRSKNIRDCIGMKKGLERDVGQCKVCHTLCLSTCSQCKVYYCGGICQKEDWLEHKKVCKPPVAAPKTTVKNSSASGTDTDDGLMVEVDDVLVTAVQQNMQKIVAKCPAPESDEAAKIELAKNCVSLIPSEMRIGETVPAVLINLHDSGVLIFQLTTNKLKLQDLDSSLNSFYANKGIKPTLIEEKNVYACRFSVDNRWYRALVQSVSDDRKICSVWYVDFGNFEDVSSENLLVLDDKFASVPAFSVRCRLHGCGDVKMKEVTQVISEIVSDPHAELKVLAVNEDIVDIEAIFIAHGTRVSLNKILQEQLLPKKAEDAVFDSEKNDASDIAERREKVVLKDTMKNEPTVSISEPRAIELSDTIESVCVPVMALSGGSKDNVKPERAVSGGKNNMDPMNVEYGEKELNLPESLKKAQNLGKTDIVPILQQSNSERKMERSIPASVVPDGKFDCVITNAESLNDISCSVVGPDLERLKVLEANLAKCCEFEAADFKAGKACVAKFSGGAEWYRAEMVSKTSDKISVFFVDYGNSEDVPKSDVCAVPDLGGFWDLPRQAIACELAGCTLGSEEYDREINEVLKRCENQIFTAEIDDSTRSDGPLPVIIHIDGAHTLNDYILQQKARFDDTLCEKTEKVKLKHVLEEQGEKICGESFDVVLMHVENPGSFVCQILGENQSKIEDLLMKMTQFYEKEHALLKNFEIGDYCAGKYNSDNQWYRGKILDIIKASEMLKVYFVDFGNEESVKKSDVAYLEDEFKVLPIQGIKGRLSGCGPTEKGAWSADSIASMLSLCNQVFTATFDEISSNIVSLSLMTSNGLSVSEALIKAGMASPVCDARKDISPLKELDTRSEELDAKLDDVIRSDVTKNLECPTGSDDVICDVTKNATHPNKAETLHCDITSKHNGTDDVTNDVTMSDVIRDVTKKDDDAANNASSIRNVALTIVDDVINTKSDVTKDVNDVTNTPVVSNSHISSYKDQFNQGSTVKTDVKYGTPMVADVRTATDESVNPGLLEKAEKSELKINPFEPELNVLHQAILTYANGPDDFYCQIVPNKTQDTLRKLEELEARYSSSKPTNALFKTGDFCAAKSTAYSTWYRAKIVSKSENKVTVHYVDFGNCEEVMEKNLRELHEDFFAIEAQAIRCSLRGCSTNEEQKNECLAVLNALLNGVVQMEFYGCKNERYSADVYLEKDVTVNEYLIRNGLVAQQEEEVEGRVQHQGDSLLSTGDTETTEESAPMAIAEVQVTESIESKIALLDVGTTLTVAAVVGDSEVICKAEVNGIPVHVHCTIKDVKLAEFDGSGESHMLNRQLKC